MRLNCAGARFRKTKFFSYVEHVTNQSTALSLMFFPAVNLAVNRGLKHDKTVESYSPLLTAVA
jgi:hypothetical protein